MVAPSLPLVDSHFKYGYVQSSYNSSLKKAPEKHDQDAICFVTSALINSNSEEARHGNIYCDRDTKGPTNCNHGTGLIKEPQSHVEEHGIHAIRESKEPHIDDNKFGPLENHAMQQEPTTKITSCAHDRGTAQQATKLMESIACAAIDAGCGPKGKRVQWNDNHGKELVHVVEYVLSDASESEEEEDDADTCACTIL